MMRRSISCMLAGLLIVVPVWLLMMAPSDWKPNTWLPVAMLIASFAIGLAWLYDEISD